MLITKEQAVSGLLVIVAVARAIKEAGRLPSGELYATLMSNVSLNGYNKIIDMLCEQRIIKVENNVLIWIYE